METLYKRKEEKKATSFMTFAQLIMRPLLAFNGDEEGLSVRHLIIVSRPSVSSFVMYLVEIAFIGHWALLTHTGLFSTHVTFPWMQVKGGPESH